MSLEVIRSGAKALVVDLGRPSLRHLGIPLSGAADRMSFQIANWIVGNAPDAAAIECALGGQAFRFTAPTRFAVTGATAAFSLNDTAIKPHTHHLARPGDTLTFGPASTGTRLYLALAGGVEGAAHFGSRSTYPLAKLGANGGRALAKGDTLATGPEQGAPNTLPTGFAPRLSNHITLRVRSATEYEQLTFAAQRRLFTQPWTASPRTNRMGARLVGGELSLEAAPDMVSSPLLPGTLQVPPDGTPILSLVDSHCTGGYPRALQLILADMWLAGQIGPGTRISFNRCLMEDAPAILATQTALWQSLIEGWQP